MQYFLVERAEYATRRHSVEYVNRVSRPLKDGRHTYRAGDAKIPFSINTTEITLYPQESQGNLRSIEVRFADDLTMDDLKHAGVTKIAAERPAPSDNSILSFYAPDGKFLALEAHTERPKVTLFRRVKTRK